MGYLYWCLFGAGHFAGKDKSRFMVTFSEWLCSLHFGHITPKAIGASTMAQCEGLKVTWSYEVPAYELIMSI